MLSETQTTRLKFRRKHNDDNTLRQLYIQLLRPRMVEEKMLNLLRQGKISKWFSGIGQEAISVGVAAALHKDQQAASVPQQNSPPHDLRHDDGDRRRADRAIPRRRNRRAS